MAVSAMQCCLAVVWGVLTIVLAVTGADAQATVTITMRLAEDDLGQPTRLGQCALWRRG